MKLEKSVFYTQKIKYLGYIITKSGVQINPEKINIIIKWPRLKNVSEVQFFLGFINFYWRFIKKYFEIAISLINLIKKDCK